MRSEGREKEGDNFSSFSSVFSILSTMHMYFICFKKVSTNIYRNIMVKGIIGRKNDMKLRMSLVHKCMLQHPAH